MRALWRGVVVALAGTLAFVSGLRAAAAAPPVCFPERAVSDVIVLRDDRLQPIGGLSAGTVVRLRAEPTAADGKWADVEITAPVAVTGRVERDRLVVFAGADLEIQPGLAWVLAGAPLTILSGDGQRARVVVVAAHGEKPSERPDIPPLEVPCALLRGAPPAGVVAWGVFGPILRGRDRVPGRPVAWDGTRALESEAGARSPPLDGRAVTVDVVRRAPILIRLEGERALVEVIDNQHWLRVRGWTAREGLLLRFPRLSDLSCGCGANPADWLSLLEPAKPSVRLPEAAPLRAIPDGRAVATLPRGSVVTPRWIGDSESLVVWIDPARPRHPPRMALIGHVSTAALGTVSAGRVNAVVVGRVKPARPGDALPDQLLIQTRPDLDVFTSRLRIPVAKDGAFRFVAPANTSTVNLTVLTPSGKNLSGLGEFVALRPGKTSTVSITLEADDADDHGARPGEGRAR